MTSALQIPHADEATSLAERVASALEELRVAMQPDGGGVELVEVKDGVVILRLVGSCLFYPSRAWSAGALERRLSERVPDVSCVKVVYPLSASVTTVVKATGFGSLRATEASFRSAMTGLVMDAAFGAGTPS